ncbi:MAG: hypothetical protein IKT79_00400 [Akkermansia sp.]|nr:hypothetical protein [Akkermansia sp.]
MLISVMFPMLSTISMGKPATSVPRVDYEGEYLYSSKTMINVQDFIDVSDCPEYKDMLICKTRVGVLPANMNDVISISFPFTPDSQSNKIREILFLIGELKSDGDIMWFSPVDLLTANHKYKDYTVSLSFFSDHPDLECEPKEMECDLFYFMPYHEEDGASYILSWCRETKDMATFNTDGHALSFPYAEGATTRIGFIISPILSIQADTDIVSVSGHFGKSAMQFKFRCRFHDTQGNTWVLAWKKLKENINLK